MPKFGNAPVTLEIYGRFDSFLLARDLTFDGLIVGGAVFTLIRARSAVTDDVDLIKPIPEAVKTASEEFAAQEGLKRDWFNERARVVNDYLKFGYGKDGVMELFAGKALRLLSPSRENLLISKLCRVVDSGVRAQDIQDIEGLKLSAQDFDSAARHFLIREGGNSGDVEKAKKLVATIRKRVYGVSFYP